MKLPAACARRVAGWVSLGSEMFGLRTGRAPRGALPFPSPSPPAKPAIGFSRPARDGGSSCVTAAQLSPICTAFPASAKLTEQRTQERRANPPAPLPRNTKACAHLARHCAAPCHTTSMPRSAALTRARGALGTRHEPCIREDRARTATFQPARAWLTRDDGCHKNPSPMTRDCPGGCLSHINES